MGTHKGAPRSSRRTAIFTLVLGVCTSLPHAQERIDADINWRIRREATDNAKLMQTLQVLTDVYGPRLTGSPNLKGASERVVKETTAWGLKNAHLEPWDFGRDGWLNERLSGRIALVGAPQAVRVTIDPPAKRSEDSADRAQFSGAGLAAGPSGPQGPPPAQGPPNAGVLTANQIAEQFDQFLVAAGAVGRVNDAGRGLLAGLTWRDLSLTGRIFNWGWTDPTCVFSVAIDW